MKKPEPEYEWTIGAYRFQVWIQKEYNDRPPDMACKVLMEGGHHWLSHDYGVTDSVSGCAFQAMCWLEQNK